jgi:hypothetical protein
MSSDEISDEQRERNELHQKTKDFQRITSALDALAKENPDRSFQSLLAVVNDEVYYNFNKWLDEPDMYEVSNDEVYKAIISAMEV